uniref:PINc domain-containing protein n=1 Tax=Meloidogyne hapla TaxID=6305 RepID=A0A1I8BG87_MELHA
MLDSNILLEGNGQSVIHNLLLPRLKRHQRYSRGKKVERQLCENMDFLVERNKRETRNNTHNEPINDSRHPCCVGYKLENKTCVKDT